MIKEKYVVEGMTCAACKAHVDKAVNKIAGVSMVNVNLLSNSMIVEYDENKCSATDITEAVIKAGYNAYLPNQATKAVKEKHYDLLKLLTAFVILLVLMYVSMGHMLSLPLPKFLNGYAGALAYAFTQFLLVLPICLIYHKYFLSGFKKLFKGSPNMDSLIALGAMASLLYGIFAIYMIGYGLGVGNADLVEKYHMNLYFESAAMILTLVSLGKYLESVSKKKTTKAVTRLMDLAPKMATVIRNGEELIVNVEKVFESDIVIVKAGDIIAVDGVVIDGNGSVNQANITGESIPVFKEIGNEVYASTILTAGYLKIKPTKVGENTSINTIIRLVEEASNSKAPISKLADKISGFFVPIVMVISLIVFIVFISTGYGIELSFNMAISVLVIACPCALGLATPVAIMVGTGKGAEAGLLIKNAEILEKAHLIDTVVLDKTGTITLGKPQVVDFESFSEDAIDIAQSIENRCNHPLALAIIDYAKSLNAHDCEVTDFQDLVGLGVRGIVNGKSYCLGNEKMIIEFGLYTDKLGAKMATYYDLGITPLALFDEERIIAFFAIQDPIKSSSVLAVSELQRKGIDVVMLTGDNKQTAEAIAKKIGVKKVIADVHPIDKERVIKSLMDEKHFVAMVGDGVNDALALTTANLGIAIGGGSDIAIESSDIILLRNDLIDVLNVISLSKRVLNTIKLNLFWAFFYNCLGILLASGIFYPAFGIKLTPMIGSLAMSFSSVFVVLNALTINLFKTKRINSEQVRNDGDLMEQLLISVNGMMCEHCVSHVEKACLNVDGVSSAKASLKDKNVLVTGHALDRSKLIDCIKASGYDAK